MKSNTSYKTKTVHDIRIGKRFVRLWHADGAIDEKLIIKTFKNLLKTPFVDPYVALMPDFHKSGDTLVGSIIPTKNIILPMVIGNDIGCGMLAVSLSISTDDLINKDSILSGFKATIPAGMNQNKNITDRVLKNSLWKIKERPDFIGRRDWGKIRRQFATLGSGNHFIELLEDRNKNLWMIIHSGSRYLGALIKNHYISIGENESGIDKMLYGKVPYLMRESSIFDLYLKDHNYASAYARESRLEMLICALKVILKCCHGIKNSDLEAVVENRIDISHNAVSQEHHFGQDLFIHRKGAIHIPKGIQGVIPGSMGTCSFIVEGRENRFSFYSAAHGAGRAMSRGEAFRQITAEAFRKNMKGIVYDSTAQLIDESPQAYKDIRTVMRGQKDLVKIVNELKPILSFKG